MDSTTTRKAIDQSDDALELAPCPLCAEYHTPNAETIEALEEAEAGKLKPVDIEALISELS